MHVAIAIRIGFELPSYTYTEPLFDVIVDQDFEGQTNLPAHGPVYLTTENNITSEQTFTVGLSVSDPADPNINSAINSGNVFIPDADYSFGVNGFISQIFLSTSQRLDVPFTLFPDNRPEGTEGFQFLVVNAVEAPQFLGPTSLSSQTLIIIEDNDRNLHKVLGGT